MVALLIVSACTTETGLADVKVASAVDAAPNEVKLRIIVERWSSDNLVQSYGHKYVYNHVSVVNVENGSKIVHQIQLGERNSGDYAVFNLPPGVYTIKSVFVQDLGSSAITRGSVDSFIEETRRNLPFTISGAMAGKTVEIHLAP